MGVTIAFFLELFVLQQDTLILKVEIKLLFYIVTKRHTSPIN